MAVEFGTRWNWTYTGPMKWDDIGAEAAWPDGMDPMNPDVARALVYAAMERAEAVRAAQDYPDPLRILRGAVAECGPWEVPRLDVYNAVREAIRLMYNRFIDWGATWAAYEDAWDGFDYDDPAADWPTVDDVHLDYTAECHDHSGLRIIGSAGSPRVQLASFCSGAYDALRRMRFLLYTGDSDRWENTVWNAFDSAHTIAEARAAALADEQEYHNNFPASLRVSSAGYENEEGWDAAYDRMRVRARIYIDPLYITNPIDGGPFKPGLRLVRESGRYWVTLNGIRPWGGCGAYECPLGWPKGPSYGDYSSAGDSLELYAEVNTMPGHVVDDEGNLATECFGFRSRMSRYADYNSDTGFLFKSYPDEGEGPNDNDNQEN